LSGGVAARAAGVALACDPEGVVTEVVSDGLGVAAHLAPGSRFAELCDADCGDKAEAFLEELRRQGGAYGWELVVRDVEGGLQTLHFAGAADQRGGFLVVGARSRAGVARAYEELLSINNEQANALRAAAKDLSLRARAAEERDARVYEELTRLNNELAAVDLHELVARNVELNRRLAERKEITILFKSLRDLPRLRLDASKIEQVLNNLVGNAVKFSPRGSTVEVGLGREGADGPVVLYVKDEGPGVPSGELEKLFEPFTRSSARGSEGEKGTGLGLAIVKRIVEGHGGRINVESEPGAGATFAVSLPTGPRPPEH